AYNCAYTTLCGPQDLAEVLYILMQGTGVGYSVERRYIDQWPAVETRTTKVGPTYVIPDTTDGWAEAFKRRIEDALAGAERDFDYSQIRPEGAWLHTKGGRASGPEPLRQLLEKTWTVIRARAGERLHPLDVHRLATLCGSIVQVGGVRRAAEIALFDADDAEMRTCKTGDFWQERPELAMANNSMVVPAGEAPDLHLLAAMAEAANAGTGEPGLFRRDGRIPARRQPAEFGTNPCFAAGTLIETTEGRIPIEKLTTASWVYTRLDDGTLGISRATASWRTRKKAMTLSIKVGNYTLSVTGNHQIYVENRGWVEAKDLRVGDRLSVILRQRRGAAYTGVKLSGEPEWRMEHRAVWEEMYGTLPEGWDVHHENGDTHDNRLSNLRPLPHNHHAYVTAHEQPNNHQCKGASGKFTGNGAKPKTIVPLPDHLKAGIHQYPTIESITTGPIVDVYDLSVEGTHNVIANGIVAHNCGEIILRPHQFCNLSVAVARPTDTAETLAEKVQLATILGTLQADLTRFQYLRPTWADNCNEERLLGVDITGACDCPLLTDPEASPLLLQRLQQVARQTNEALATAMGIPVSAAITCNKPSGNSSQLLDASSGIHPRYAPYYLRRLRLGARSPLALHLQRLGLPMEPEVGQGTLEEARVWVTELPVESPEGALTRHDLSGLDQLAYWLMWKTCWTEHNPSCTIYLKPHEWVAATAFVASAWEAIGGLSFLPHSDHVYALAPYEEIDRATYEARVAALPEDLGLDMIREYVDSTTIAQDYACVGGVCEV
ncbi:MAG: hypothetical protein EBS05_25130, partial [Proteobacteria bacterium]|nr:hypothetical protein [Pseudomonadota bacterium]